MESWPAPLKVLQRLIDSGCLGGVTLAGFQGTEGVGGLNLAELGSETPQRPKIRGARAWRMSQSYMWLDETSLPCSPAPSLALLSSVAL